MPAYRAGTSLGSDEPVIGRRDRRFDVAVDFGGTCQGTDEAFTVFVRPDRDDFGDLAIAMEDDNRFPSGRATNELTGPIAKLANLDPLHTAIVAKVLGQVKDAGLRRLADGVVKDVGARKGC